MIICYICFLFLGLKNQLVARLAKALKTEADPTSNGGDVEDDVEMIESDVAKDEEGEKIKEDVVGIIDENITEMDMSEVTVIDEYDSTKCEEPPVDEKLLAKKREEARKLDEKERHLLEKRYALPENPQIVVHPSRTAKNGKFDCTVMSLSLLLDYRPEDTKEHSFEVSLFAELFNEMLMRDFGFNIYKAITLFPSIKPKEEIKKDDKKDDKEKAVKPIVTEDVAEKLKAPESSEDKTPVVEEVAEKVPEVEIKEKVKPKEEETDKEKEKEKDRRREKDHDRKRPVAGEKRRREDESDNDSFSNRSETESHRSGRSKREKADKVVEKAVEKVERIKYFTAFPDLLLSFVYFDQTNCGYMFEKDIEDLFYTLGLNLSRSQVRKIAEKFVTRDSLYYRRLCDRAVDVPFENPFENVSEEHLQKLAHGNQTSDGGKIEMRDRTTVVDDDNDKVVADTTTVATSGLVQFNGGLFDIKKLLEQMKRSEVARENTEKILVELRLKNTELTTSNNRNSSKIKDLNSDLKSITRKLLDTEQNLSTTTVRD